MVTKMTDEWNGKRLAELVRKMGLRRTPGQGKSPIHLSLYGASRSSHPLLTKIVQLDSSAWMTLGYDETDRVSVIRHLGSSECRKEGALSWAVRCRRPLPLDLAKLLVDVGACDEDALKTAAQFQQPLTLELTKLLVDAGAFDDMALAIAARFQQPLTLELAKLLIDAGACNEDALTAAAQFQNPLTLELVKLFVDARAFDDMVLSVAARFRHPLTLDLAKLLIDAGAFNKGVLRPVIMFQHHPLTLELTKPLIDAGCDPTVQDDNGWDALVDLPWSGRPVDPQVTDLFLSVGCRTSLDGCSRISDKHRIRFGQILKEHVEWKLTQECAPTDDFRDLDWGK